MNRNNTAVLILVIALVALLSYFLGSAVLGGQTSKAVSVEKAKLIGPDVVTPESNIFNSDAINPTVKITIGENNQNPIGN